MNGLPHRQRGVAMLVAILLVALGTIIAAAVAYESAMTARRGNATIGFDEALLVGEGAEALAGFGLQQIMRNSQGSTQSGSGTGTGTGTNPTGGGRAPSGSGGGVGGGSGGVPSGGVGGIDIYPSQAWAERIGPLEVVPGVMLEASMEDLQGRFNLNWLVDPSAQAAGSNGNNPLGIGQQPNPNGQQGGGAATGQQKAAAARAVFTRLLEELRIDPQWTDKIVDWIDSNQMPEPQGAEDSAYLSQNPSYLTANQYLTSTTELLAIPGFGRENYERLAPYITAIPPEETSLNLCTAPAMVLSALTGKASSEWNDQDALDKNRANVPGCFPTPSQFRITVEDPTTKPFSEGMTGTTSRYFRLTSLVTIGTAEFNLYSLLFVDGAGYYVHPIQRSFTPD